LNKENLSFEQRFLAKNLSLFRLVTIYGIMDTPRSVGIFCSYSV